MRGVIYTPRDPLRIKFSRDYWKVNYDYTEKRVFGICNYDRVLKKL